MHIILFLKINLKRKKLIETVFLKIKKMKIAGFLKSFPHVFDEFPLFLVKL